MTQVLMWALACILVSVGFAGTILPVLPGAPLIFGGLFLAAWIDNFQRVTWVTLAVLGVLTVLSLVVDFVATGISAHRVGATRLATIGALLGSLIGIFFGIPGLILGPFVGAVAGELMSHGQIEQASRVGVATWTGLILGTVAKLGLAFTMVGIFVAAYFY
jgi:uncharacterized protein YqgC (DUF456 family)